MWNIYTKRTLSIYGHRVHMDDLLAYGLRTWAEDAGELLGMTDTELSVNNGQRRRWLKGPYLMKPE